MHPRPTPPPLPTHRRARPPRSRASRSFASLVALAWLCLPPCARAADYLTRTWHTGQGLPHNVVHRVTQDGVGFLWLATAGGLVRFDGLVFTTFAPPPSLTGGEYEIRDLVCENDSTLVVVANAGGVLRIRDGVFSPHPVSPLLAGQAAMDIFAEPDGTLWIGTREGTLARWTPAGGVLYGSADGIARRGNGFTFARDENGRTWVAAAEFLGCHRDGRLVRDTETPGRSILLAPARGGGFWRLSNERLLLRSEGRWTERPLPERPWVAAESSVRHLLEDADGTLWFGTVSAGLYHWDGSAMTLESDRHPPINRIFPDREANLWIATDGGGLRRLRPRAFRHHKAAEDGAPIIGVGVGVDDVGDLWFANRNQGLARLHDGRFDTLPCRDGARNVSPACIAPAPDGGLWIGGPGGLFRFSPAHPLETRPVDPRLPPVHALLRTRSGDLWVAAQPGVLGRRRGEEWRAFGPADGIPEGDVTALAEAHDGAIWVGFRNGALLRFADERFTAANIAPRRPPTRIHALHPDGDHALWIGTLDGLLLLRDGRVHRFTRRDGLAEDNICQILEDDAGRLWFAGSRGIFAAAKADLLGLADGRPGPVVVRSYGDEEGLPGLSASTRYAPSAWKSRDGRLWFCTHRGPVSINPAAVRRNPTPPVILVAEARADEVALPLAGPLRTPVGAHRLDFSFVALGFVAPEKIRLRHRLEGFETDWVETDATRVAHYGNLPPGAYRLRVIGRNEDGVWNTAGATLAFTVPSAWWQTAWFRIPAAAGLLGLTTLGARAITRRRLLRRLERLELAQSVETERARVARDLHDELGGGVTALGLLFARMRPPPDPEARDLHRLLGERIHRLGLDLERVVWTASPRNDTLERFVAFTARFSAHYFRGTGLRCIVAIPDHPIPGPLAPAVRHHLSAILRESLHNALKHADAREVRVTLSATPDLMVLEIRDDGRGAEPAALADDSGHGLANLRDRAARLGATLVLESAPGQGFTVRLSTPLPVSCHS